MNKRQFQPLDMHQALTQLPNGIAAAGRTFDRPARYEAQSARSAETLILQLLGLGPTGIFGSTSDLQPRLLAPGSRRLDPNPPANAIGLFRQAKTLPRLRLLTMGSQRYSRRARSSVLGHWSCQRGARRTQMIEGPLSAFVQPPALQLPPQSNHRSDADARGRG